MRSSGETPKDSLSVKGAPGKGKTERVNFSELLDEASLMRTLGDGMRTRVKGLAVGRGGKRRLSLRVRRVNTAGLGV